MAKTKVILVDSDVISHFIATNHIFDLNEILNPHHLLVVENVYREAIRHPWDDNRKNEVDEWLRKSNASKISFPRGNSNIVKEFYSLKHNNKLLGDGECACMAIARFGKETIASSNFRDVAEYCDENDIEYIGVMDILWIALNKGYWSVEQCDKFIREAVIVNQARFPVNKIEDYNPTRDLKYF